MNIANEDLTVNFVPVVVPPDAIYAGDQGIDPVKIVPIKSTKVKMNNKFACLNNITLTFATVTPCPFSSASYTFLNGLGNITASSLKITGNVQAFLLQGNTGICNGNWQLTASPFTSLACSCNLNIATAGQVKVLGI